MTASTTSPICAYAVRASTGLTLRLVIRDHLGRGADSQRERDVLAVDDDSIAVDIAIAGLRRFVVENDSTGEHPFLDLASRAKSVLR